jgi:YfiH family protein
VSAEVVGPGWSVGVPAGFSTRVGGVSAGVFASLNFGNPGDLPAERRDAPANIAENFARLTRALGNGAEGRTVREVHQVHGCEVVTIRAGQAWPERDPKADAMVTNDPSLLLAVRVADCAPVLLASRDGRVVGAAHAGWRGAVSRVCTRTVEAMGRLGVNAGEVVAAVGPCIGPAALEVGPEVVAAFRGAFGERAAVREGGAHAREPGKGYVDLAESIRRELLEAGVAEVHVSGLCTVERADLFFSHRREKGVTGRMVGVIGVGG